jgi:hypothetical protein
MGLRAEIAHYFIQFLSIVRIDWQLGLQRQIEYEYYILSNSNASMAKWKCQWL